MPTIPPALTGIVETVLYVEDLVRAAAFYREVIGLLPMTGDPARFQSFQAGAAHVLLLFTRGTTVEAMPTPGGIIPGHNASGHQHIGFAIKKDGYEAWAGWLRSRGISIESETHWPRGGRSLYFRDPDGHLVELITPGIWPNY